MPEIAEMPIAEWDEINDMLQGAFFGATYGNFFFPGAAYLIAVYLLFKVRKRREEFSRFTKNYTTRP